MLISDDQLYLSAMCYNYIKNLDKRVVCLKQETMDDQFPFFSNHAQTIMINKSKLCCR